MKVYNFHFQNSKMEDDFEIFAIVVENPIQQIPATQSHVSLCKYLKTVFKWSLSILTLLCLFAVLFGIHRLLSTNVGDHTPSIGATTVISPTGYPTTTANPSTATTECEITNPICNSI